MRILADVHISPRTVELLRSLGHDTVRDALTPEAADEEIIAEAERDQRIILTQDLDFSDIVALSGRAAPSVVSLRLGSSRIETVNARLKQV
jgi:predicted nuclease of predicted toxin-antitoxin system